METTEKKKKSGNDYLKEKIAKLEAENKSLNRNYASEFMRANKLEEDLKEETRQHETLKRRFENETKELQGNIDKQRTIISKNVAEISRLESAIDANAKKVGAVMDEMMRYMGPIRRWFFYLKHKEGVL